MFSILFWIFVGYCIGLYFQNGWFSSLIKTFFVIPTTKTLQIFKPHIAKRDDVYFVRRWFLGYEFLSSNFYWIDCCHGDIFERSSFNTIDEARELLKKYKNCSGFVSGD